MKIRVLDRLLVALAGLVLLALCAGIVAQVFCNVPVTELMSAWVSGTETTALIIYAAVALALLLVGLYCFFMLFRHKKGKRGFVTQQAEGGELSISLKAMEALTHQCVDSHPEMKLNAMRIEPEKDGVTVKVHITLASGVSIPLAVGALQKQIRTYLTSCSGVDVKEVCVQVDTSADQAKDSPYAVQGVIAPAAAPLLQASEAKKEEVPVPEEGKATEEPAKEEPVVEEPVVEEPVVEETTTSDAQPETELSTEPEEEQEEKTEPETVEETEAVQEEKEAEDEVTE